MDQISVKYIFNIFSGSTPESGQAFFWDGDHNWFTPDDLGKIGNKIYIDESNRKVTDEGVENANLKFGVANSIIITKRAPIGNLAITTLPSSCNQGCFILEQNSSEINVKYYYYYFLIQKDRLNNLGRGSTFLELNADEMKSHKAPLPSLTQQNKIVDYLDNEVAKIDALIEKKIQLITILEEKKKAVINRAVTKGLDSNVSMKDSEIEWLGDIPEHWKILKLKYLTSKIGDGLHSTPEYTPDENYYFINGVNLKNGKIEYNNKTNTVSFEEFLKYKIDFSEKTLFLSLNGTIGNIALYNNENIILGKSAAFIDLADDTLCDRFFLYYILQSQVIQQYFEMSLSGTTIKNLSLFTLRNTPLVLPDMDSQLNIVKYLNKELDKLDYLNSRINNSIELLKEQRVAIISAAVNGELNASLS